MRGPFLAMASPPESGPQRLWRRCELLPLGAAALGLGLGGLLLRRGGSPGWTENAASFQPPAPGGLREFEAGRVLWENGRRVHEFDLTASTTLLQLNPAVTFKAWAVNGRVPGPTLRARAG